MAGINRKKETEAHFGIPFTNSWARQEKINKRICTDQVLAKSDKSTAWRRNQEKK